MSAWLCENKLLSIVVDVIKSNEFRNNYDTNHKYCDKDELELLNQLSDINTGNLHYLYSSFPSEIEERIMNNREYVPIDVNEYQKHKSVCSFIYQSCDYIDYDKLDDDDLFNLLLKWRDSHINYEDNVEWEKAEWDIDNPIGASNNI